MLALAPVLFIAFAVTDGLHIVVTPAIRNEELSVELKSDSAFASWVGHDIALA